MEPCLVIQPHFDDAALSVGQFLGSWPGATVLTVFSGIPADPVVTTYDVHCSFKDSTQAMRTRWHEDQRALRVFRASAVHGGLLDNQYRASGESPGDVVDVIRRTVEAVGTTRVVGPLGLAHPDHEIVANALLAFKQDRSDVSVWLYEDIPTRVTHPELVPLALDRARSYGFDVALDFLGTSPVEAKERAVACYRSQLWSLDQRCLYVPERFWRISHV